jgi:hypothetical protein
MSDNTSHETKISHDDEPGISATLLFPADFDVLEAFFVGRLTVAHAREIAAERRRREVIDRELDPEVTWRTRP